VIGAADAEKEISPNVKISVDSIGADHQNSELTHP